MKFLIVALMLGASAVASEPTPKEPREPKVETIRIHLDEVGPRDGIKSRIINDGGGAGTGGVG